MSEFPVFKSVGEVFSGVTRHYFELLKAAPVTVLAYAILMIALAHIMAPAVQENLSQEEASAAMIALFKSQWPTLLALGIGALLCAFSAAVRWHRFVLIGERQGPIWGHFETRYLLTGLKMWLAAILLMVGMGILIGLVLVFAGAVIGSGTVVKVFSFAAITIVMVFFYLFIARVSLALPDAAMGGEGHIRKILAKTRGNSWRLLGYMVVIQLAVALVYGVITRVLLLILKPVIASAIPALVGSEQLVVTLICMPLSIYALMAGVTMLSVAYREIIGLPTAPAAEPA